MLIDRFPQLKGLILDMDGVLWHDNQPIGDLPAIFASMKYQGLEIILMTNNATKVINDYVLKLAAFGVHVTADQVMSSAEATASILAREFKPGSSAYVVGSPALKETIQNHGLTICPESEDKHADVVVAGLDRQITYEKIRNSSLLVQAGVPFYATNLDATFPSPEGFLPGAGTFVAAVATAGGREPIVIGKPYPDMYLEAARRFGFDPSQAMGIGDRLETDIQGAQEAGCLTGLVLTGVATRAQGEAWPIPIDIIAEDLTSLING